MNLKNQIHYQKIVDNIMDYCSIEGLLITVRKGYSGVVVEVARKIVIEIPYGIEKDVKIKKNRTKYWKSIQRDEVIKNIKKILKDKV
jgi:hypothetical protein